METSTTQKSTTMQSQFYLYRRCRMIWTHEYRRDETFIIRRTVPLFMHYCTCPLFTLLYQTLTQKKLCAKPCSMLTKFFRVMPYSLFSANLIRLTLCEGAFGGSNRVSCEAPVVLRVELWCLCPWNSVFHSKVHSNSGNVQRLFYGTAWVALYERGKRAIWIRIEESIPHEIL